MEPTWSPHDLCNPVKHYPSECHQIDEFDTNSNGLNCCIEFVQN